MNLYRAGSAAVSPSHTDEARLWLDSVLRGGAVPPLLVVFGLGDGTLLEVLDQRAPGTRVLAVEPDKETAAACLSRPHVQEWQRRERLTYLMPPTFHGSSDAWRMFPAGADAHKLITHPDLDTNHPTVVQAAQVLKTILFGVRANNEARKKFAPRFLINALRNSPRLAAGGDVRALTNAFAGVPAILVAAGPSLDDAIEHLRGVTDRALLIAVDTALRPLLHAGIHPQLVVGADPGIANARHFWELPACPDTWLVAESGLDARACAAFEDRTFWFRIGGHHPWPWLKEAGIDVGKIDMWGSVLTAAFQVACLAGCDPIVFVGSDLAFSGGRPYARGTTYEFDWAEHTAQGLALDNVWASRVNARPLVRVADVNGATTPTTASLVSFRDWLVARVPRSGRRVINAGGAGILYGPGIEHLALPDLLSTFQPRSSSFPSLASLQRSVGREGLLALASRLDTLDAALADKATQVPAVAEWLEFTDKRVPAAFMRSAVEQARALLGRMVRSERPAETTAAFVSSPSVSALIPFLPEGMARFRTALAGNGTLPPARIDPNTALAASFSLLQQIQHVAGSFADVRPPEQAPDDWRTPVPTGRWASEPVRWAVTNFQALVGQAWGDTHGRERPAVPFAMRPVESMGADTGKVTDAVSFQPAPAYANALLALYWLRCAAGQRGVAPEDAARVLAWCEHLQGAASVSVPAVPDAGLGLSLTTTVGEETRALEIPLPGSQAQLARVLTGAFQGSTSSGIEVAHISAPKLRVSLGVRLAGRDCSAGAQPCAFTQPPRVLTDRGMARAMVAYQAGDGVVCVVPQTQESVMVAADGSVTPHHAWPRTMHLELPFGDTGALAWSNGLAHWPDAVPPYVMYRRSAGDEPVVEELPFRPSVGVWWQGRVYFCCLPGGIGAWTGVASWAPGEEPRLELPGVALFGIEPRGDRLLLQPRALKESGGFSRTRLSQGWLWRPGQDPVPTILGPFGAASGRATAGPWTATAHPEADTVRFESETATRSMICYWPHRLAWLGRSLLVNTVDWDVLLFENVLDVLELKP